MVRLNHERHDPRQAGGGVLRSRRAVARGQYGEMIDRELAQWGAIVRETGVQVKT